MDEERYLTTQAEIMALGQIVSGMPLDEFIQAAQRSLGVGYFIDPTLWIRGQDNLNEIVGLASALRKFQQAVKQAADRQVELVKGSGK